MLTAFDRWLDTHPDGLVAAMSEASALVRVPDDIDLRGVQPFVGGSALGLVVAADQPRIVESFLAAMTDPVVEVTVSLELDPEHPAHLVFFDLRDSHGVHLLAVDVRDRRLALEALAARRPSTGRGRAVRNGVGAFLEIDHDLARLLGVRPTDLVGSSSIELVHPDDVGGAIDHWMSLRMGADVARNQLRLRHADGRFVWLDVYSVSHLDAPEAVVESYYFDIDDHMAEIEALQDRERLLAGLAAALPTGVGHIRTDGGIDYANDAFADLLGPVTSIGELLAVIDPVDRAAVERLVDRTLLGPVEPIDARLVGREHDLRDGVATRPRLVELRFRRMGEGGGIVVAVADVTDDARLREELEHRANHDDLSGLLNRAATIDALSGALARDDRLAVAYIDLDGLKGVNDHLGHNAGDTVLSVVAARLRHATRSIDVIGRVGGDEFVVLCPTTGGEVDVDTLRSRLGDAVRGDVTVGGERIAVSASVGVAEARTGDDAESVLHRADQAMYERKRRRRRRANR